MIGATCAKPKDVNITPQSISHSANCATPNASTPNRVATRCKLISGTSLLAASLKNAIHKVRAIRVLFKKSPVRVGGYYFLALAIFFSAVAAFFAAPDFTLVFETAILAATKGKAFSNDMAFGSMSFGIEAEIVPHLT